ncbi:molting protein mlt-4 [Anaeramoeba ignava]|uniref:Molting protein mlt-4 n=1 Tax=Anaeramoeba ignava TaxID=1746090 RepID=A0A9Q0L7F9_ANAIG|nr:molting protein mlt-4 [Anaeramoeba ignava]
MNKDIYQEFFVACKNGDIEFINKNIDKIEDINHPDLNGSTALMISQFFHHNNISNVLIEHGAKLVLHEAVKDGNIKIIELVLKIPFLNINAVDLTGKTALHYAVMNNNQAIVTLLIKTGSNVNLLDQDHLTPLLIAARNGYLKMAKILIKSGADITIQNLNGMNCLHYSILYSHVDIFKFILKHISSNPETMKILNQQNEFDETPLHCSVENKNQQFITQLIAIGSDVNIQNKQGKTPFHLSIAEEKIGFVGLFFRKEAKVQVQINTQDKDGKTPLIDSIDLGNSFLISILLSYFADANIFDNKGFNAFHHAIIKNQPNTLTHLLRDSRSSPLSTTDGIPCLHLCAICNENMECFDILMKFLKSPSYKEETDREGNTILHHAAKNSRKQFITKHKEITDINKQNEEGNTVLHIIATTGNTELMLQIIRETNINIENKKKQTPLHLSCFNGNYECSKILISYGAKLDQQDDQQHTPLFLALSKGFIDIVELLLDNGAMEQVFDAVKNSNMEIANIYVELGFPSWVNNKESKNLLHYAVEANNIEIAKKIIPTCKNINIRNGNGMNAIQIASKNGFFEICEILIEYGANLIHYTDIMQRPHILAENHKHKKCAQFIKKHFMRDFSIFELIDTEKNYLRILSGLISKIIDPLSNRTSSIEKNNPMISKDQLELIFSNIQNIYQDGSLFLSNLLERFKNWNPKKGVGDIAKNHIPQFVSNYIIYNNNFDRSIQTLKQARKQNHSFANFLKIQEQDPFFQRLELDAILIQPVQRIGQYKLLFEQIQKYTDESHPDYQDLTDALEIVNKFGNQRINLLDQSHRRLIQEGFITFQFLERKSNRFLSPVSRDMKQKA